MLRSEDFQDWPERERPGMFPTWATLALAVALVAICYGFLFFACWLATVVA